LRVIRYGFLLAIAAVPLLAQETSPETPEAREERPPQVRSIRSAVELQVYNFGNFFQASDGEPKRDVNAVGAAYRATWVRPGNRPDVYGRLAVLRYSGGASETSYTGQAGISKYASVHWYDVYVERTENGYAFDIDETRASANITTLSGHYSYGITPDWRVGTDLYADRTRFNVDADLENDYTSLGVDVRYRGFGRLVQPRIGYVAGTRDAENRLESADDRYWFVELRTQPTAALDVRLRYRDRTLDFQNTTRTDDRTQWLLRASYRQNERFTYAASYRLDAVDSSVAGRDYDRNTAFFSVTYGF
jgi:hypothetical protein